MQQGGGCLTAAAASYWGLAGGTGGSRAPALKRGLSPVGQKDQQGRGKGWGWLSSGGSGVSIYLGRHQRVTVNVERRRVEGGVGFQEAGHKVTICVGSRGGPGGGNGGGTG